MIVILMIKMRIRCRGMGMMEVVIRVVITGGRCYFGMGRIFET